MSKVIDPFSTPTYVVSKNLVCTMASRTSNLLTFNALELEESDHFWQCAHCTTQSRRSQVLPICCIMISEDLVCCSVFSSLTMALPLQCR